MMADMLGAALFNEELPFVPTIDFYTGEWYSGEVWEKSTKKHKKGDPKLVKRTSEQLRKAESANVLFGTAQLISEGFNVPAIDVIVLATPKSDIEQIVGRARRWCTPDKDKCERLCPWRSGKCKEKPNAIVMDVVDKVERLMPKWKRRQAFYRKIGTL
jgi:superfamily II DNA or RNA helicase